MRKCKCPAAFSYLMSSAHKAIKMKNNVYVVYENVVAVCILNLNRLNERR